MSRKDFELIARTILDLPTMTSGDITPAMRNDIAMQFDRALRLTNDCFDSARFLKACGFQRA